MENRELGAVGLAPGGGRRLHRPMTTTNEKASSGRRGHHWRDDKRHKPRYSVDYQTPFGGAAKALAIDSDVRLRTMLGDKVSRHTIRNWRRGHQSAPQWALDVLEREAARLQTMADLARHYLARAKKDPP